MYENVTYDVIMQRMLGRVSDQLDKRESSLIWDTASSTAAELQIIYIELDTLIANSYGDTAAREFLILLCKDRGITPEPATKAILKGEFTPTSIDLIGQRFNIGDINYIVTELISAGQYEVQCETVGEIGNQYLGAMIPIQYIDGLQTASLTEILIPGEDEESTDALRERYFDSFNEQAFGGNRADYLAKVRAIDGVGDVKVTRVWNGDISPASLIPNATVTAWYESVIGSMSGDSKTWLQAIYAAATSRKLTVGGTVLITIVNSLNYGEASSTLVQSVQTAIDPVQNAGEGCGLAPIGHIVNVQSASPVTLYITTVLTFDQGYNWQNLSTAITDAVSEYLLELRQDWADYTNTVVRISQIESKITAVEGVIDISDTKINGVASNLSLTKYQVPVLGGVTAP